MFIQLTDADNGQACDVRAECVQAVRILDQTRTEIVLFGGSSIEVRESPWKVIESIEMTTAPASSKRSGRERTF